ncbi:hypothetical protein FO519_009722 [Halicephalobus sp. NKZ332]|nr:hypothetical protein FO519_009722 [Halicephalobus sp. NKZ332]
MSTSPLWYSLYGVLHGYGVFWIGVTNLLGGTWKNIDDGSNITFSNWAPGQPTNDKNSSCAAIDTQGLWFNENCEAAPLFVCGVPSDGSETGTASAIRP